ncbi:phosphate acetyltransferase [Campylobacter pinnipediorum]|uniref:phosphate acetyltransferase n=1 Tax=Campylobacter pinnipediorum TaxID=1965231 RepID=UPI00084DCD43|nr:phosphate acetyltransferase [Campylobacter pinnipediorum]AQW81129.1 phosphate acetyltransferase [Campylobacter pinnipediorum subsp. pinnipediorum]OPA78080.1 phosphate acetyltransferase [Campylobacter pinnipediorum subsp. pinnipediorum]
MRCLYLNCAESLLNLKEELSKKFSKVAVFEIKLGQKEQELLQLENEKTFFIDLINKFNEFKKGNDFVIVVGCDGFGIIGKYELNLKIAKNLNCPIYEIKNLNALKNLNKNSKLLITNDLQEIISFEQNIITPYQFENLLTNRARDAKATVILPESDDDRILKASDLLLKQDVVSLIILGDQSKVFERANELGLDLKKAKIINPESNEYQKDVAASIYEKRKAKGMTEENALKLAKDRTYFGTMLVELGIADAMVSGASTTTAETIRPALQLIKTKPGVSIVSGLFFMSLDEEVLLYADCAITPNPDPEALASIAISTAESAKSFGIVPKVAMLSYSTGESGTGPDVDMIKEAAKILKEKDPELKFAAPIQYDAAADITVGAKKMPGSQVAGHANVFVFPSLNTGNICYKAVQRTANALAIGPVLQGLRKPVNDLSRGCLVEDIINTVLISAIQAKG